MKKVVFVVGNGFDLNLGLSTSYSHFMRSNYFQNLVAEDNSLCKHLNTIQQQFRWIDVENELSNYSIEHSSKNYRFHDEYQSLKGALMDYFRDIKYSDIDRNAVAFNVFINYYRKCNPKDSPATLTVVNFNYTKTIQWLIDNLYGSPNNSYSSPIQKIVGVIEGGIEAYKFIKDIFENNPVEEDEDKSNVEIKKPHGGVEENYIIMGVEDSAAIKRDHIFLKKSCDIHYRQGINTNDFDSCDVLVVFGHSLGQTDHTYFKDFFEQQSKRNANRKIIKIYYYGEREYYKLMEQIDILTNNKVNLLRENNDVEFIDVRDKHALEDESLPDFLNIDDE